MGKSEVQTTMTTKLQEMFMRDPSSSAEVLTKFLLNVTAADVHRRLAKYVVSIASEIADSSLPQVK